MTLEPVHMQEILQIAREIEFSAPGSGNAGHLTDIFDMLTLLSGSGTILEAVGTPFRRCVSKKETALRTIGQESVPEGPVYACDSGSTNPIPFDCGLFIDICHAVISSVPGNAGLRRKKTIVCGVYASDRDMIPGAPSFYSGNAAPLMSAEDLISGNPEDGGDPAPETSPFFAGSDSLQVPWKYFDDGNARSVLISIDPAVLKSWISGTVHDVSMYLAESEHILWLLPDLDPSGVFIMDGPVYPKQLLFRLADTPADSDNFCLRYDPAVQKILQNYVSIADFFMAHKIPYFGFVKNPADRKIVQNLKDDAGQKMNIPWSTDGQMFKALLDADDIPGRAIPDSDRLAYTNWFIRPGILYDDIFKNGNLSDIPVRHQFSPEDYTLAFFAVCTYIEGRPVIFKAEAPYGLIRDDRIREAITQKVLLELSLGPVPEAISHADTLAKISVAEKNTIRSMFRGLAVDTGYNEIRWGDGNDFRCGGAEIYGAAIRLIPGRIGNMISGGLTK